MSEQEMERRSWPLERLEIRAGEGSPAVVEGYAAVFNQFSVDLGGWRERIAPGAFERSLAANDIRALWDHNSQYVLGRNRAKTLELTEDEHGLAVRAQPPATTWAGDLLESMRRGDVNQMSFGFIVRQDEWIEDPDVGIVRVLRDVDLFDVSVVTYPAYPQTTAEARARAMSYQKQQPGPADIDAERARARARRAARRREIEIETMVK